MYVHNKFFFNDVFEIPDGHPGRNVREIGKRESLNREGKVRGIDEDLRVISVETVTGTIKVDDGHRAV